MTNPCLNPIKERVVLVDVLRGFALAGIIVIHNLEHYNLWAEADKNLGWLSAYDSKVWTIAWTLFSGKAYAIFSLLFGFSFWVQYSRREARGEPFVGRFVWRMAILFTIGVLHGAFYNGDILSLYALSSWVLLLTRKWSDKMVLLFAIFLLLQPWELIRIAIMFTHPDQGLHHPSWEYGGLIWDNQLNGSYLKMLSLNLTYGHLGNLAWTWEYGRFFQAPGLFLLGMLAARKKLFSEVRISLWTCVLLLAVPTAWLMNTLRGDLLASIAREDLKDLVEITTGLYLSLPMMLSLLALVILIWRCIPFASKIMGLLAPFGRSSLSNYVFSNVFGTLLYWGSGFGLYHYLGAALSASLALLTISLQITISHLWLKRWKQGPLEFLWKKATWLGYKKQ